MKDLYFVLHHIGGRAGTRAFPKVSALEHEFISVMYEASDDGNDQILEVGSNRGTGQTLLVNACVGKPGATQLFNLNLDPFTSSLLSLDPKYKDFYMQAQGFDYVMGEAISAVKQELMLTQSLDDLISEKNLPKCDFLSIDTQGSELEILENCERTLQNCVGLQLEVCFVQRYKNQPLFGEVNSFLISRGFEFIKFKKFGEWAPLVTGVDCRAEKMQVEADAIYLKSAASLQPENFYPLIFTALAYGQTEFAIHAAQSFGSQIEYREKREWMMFCDSFLSLAERSKNNRPTFGQKFSIEKSFSRFSVGTSRPLKISDTMGILRKIFWSIPRPIRASIQKAEMKSRKILSKRQYKKMAPTKIELLFDGVGLSAVSESLKRSRCS